MNELEQDEVVIQHEDNSGDSEHATDEHSITQEVMPVE